MSDEAQTERMSVAEVAAEADSPAKPPPWRNPTTILLAILGVLMLGILIVLVLLLSRGDTPQPVSAPTPTESVEPTPSETPSETPVESATPTPVPSETTAPPPPPPPPPAGPIKTYTASTTNVNCSGNSEVPVTFSWSATGVTLWFGVGTTNAKTGGLGEYDLNDTVVWNYQCGQDGGQQIYTITVEASNGNLTHKTITIKE